MFERVFPRSALLFGAALTLSACEAGTWENEQQPVPIDRTAQVAERSVMIGLDGARFDACGRDGRVVQLPLGEEGLAVRTAPAESAEQIGQLEVGARVAMCQRTGGWIGIVYAPRDAVEVEPAPGEAPEGEAPSESLTLPQCGTRSPVREARAYDGPCQSGWVKDNYIRLISG